MKLLIPLACAAALSLQAPLSLAAPTRPQQTSAHKAALSAADRAFETQSRRFIEALWRIDPDAALAAGRFERAAQLPLPTPAQRTERLAFTEAWLQRLGAIDAATLSSAQRSDQALLINKLKYDRWELQAFREFEWNPAAYGVAGSLENILNTAYAPQPQRLRALLARIAAIPAYYEAAQASLKRPTLEHTRLAIAQAPGNLALLDDLGKAAQDSSLRSEEKRLFDKRLAAARQAVQGYVSFLSALEPGLAADPQTRSFRIGREHYDTKFALDIQSGSTAEQTYRKALAAREDLLARMNTLADTLWAKTMGEAAVKPADRVQKIGAVIDKLSSQHVAAADFFKEIRRQIPLLQDWVVQHDLLTLDPKKPLIVRETPVYQRGVAGAGIEAPGPYRPQDRTYYNVTPFDGLPADKTESALREYNHWILQILNIHEAVPGHYTQLVYANQSPSLVKSLFGNGAMVEGWAVYGERMVLESGYGDNAPEMWLMYCKWNLRSVTNTILDYSVHVLGMDEAEAMQMLTHEAFQTEQEAREKWRRVQLTSVQLTSYFSGYSEIMELRDEQRQALGSGFKLKDFHEKFLSYGNAPVRVIRELMQPIRP